ncbi:MAG: insulinase family protein [Blastocatellia bacterium]|nr:insulinase family protein [Blastocatellia bacterium]
MESKSVIHNSIRTGHNFDVQKTKLGNGLVLVTEQMPQVRSVSFGVFLRSGSRNESEGRHGLTHFIEHALFKGTEKRSAAQIAAESDALGGHLDAFTGREVVGFYNKVLDNHLTRAFELIADLLTAPAFDPVELEKERNVILEEIKMVEDTPDDFVFDIFCENFYPDHPLGRPILGTPESLSAFNHELIRSYYEELYTPENLLVAAAGNLEHGQLMDLAQRYFGDLQPRASRLDTTTPVAAAPIILRQKSELEQAHLVIGSRCPSAVSEDRYATTILTVILGGGMSSRLFQAIREDRGLVYSIFAAATPFNDCGYLSIYAAASTEQLEETVAATMAELSRIKSEPVEEEELERNKDQLKSSLMLNLESTSSRMSSLAQQEMTHGCFASPDEIIAQVDAVTADDVRRVANEIFKPEEIAITVLGDLDGFSIDRKLIMEMDSLKS